MFLKDFEGKRFEAIGFDTCHGGYYFNLKPNIDKEEFVLAFIANSDYVKRDISSNLDIDIENCDFDFKLLDFKFENGLSNTSTEFGFKCEINGQPYNNCWYHELMVKDMTNVEKVTMDDIEEFNGKSDFRNNMEACEIGAPEEFPFNGSQQKKNDYVLKDYKKALFSFK